MDTRAGFHKSCTGMYNKQKLEHKRKSYEKQNTETEGPSRKMTRLSTSLKNFSEDCFFFVKSRIPNNSYINDCQYLLAIAWRLRQKTLRISNCLESLVRETWLPQKQNITANAFWTYLIAIASRYVTPLWSQTITKIILLKVWISPISFKPRGDAFKSLSVGACKLLAKQVLARTQEVGLIDLWVWVRLPSPWN